ncbi:hypothetical protein BDY21DRAFT_385207 [Lineolata rhizophorae]|uniref:Ketoreductase domain-containing protein n=1 Tax=Lineolata rhizophorae TaxID=578093 RepID=A0A6A6P422_9PEZI|nr:hypothetical protein BDY21DRAFT_385207 [Lineolata rhizophorae]
MPRLTSTFVYPPDPPKTPPIKLPQNTPRAPPKPWSHHVTVDTILAALNRTILHPFVAWMVPLTLRAQLVDYDHPWMRAAIAWAALLTLLFVVDTISRRVAFGLPRDVELEEEVVVITGGAGGLGALIAEVYGLRGVSVAVLDIRDEKEVGGALQGVTYYQCDVGDRQQVEKTAEKIRKELGTPTILINNAAIMHGKSILDLTHEEIEKTFQTNLLSHFYTIKAFLPGMYAENRGTIVTVSSVLGRLPGAANLSAYASSKSGLLALHASLSAELAASAHPSAPYIKTLLVTPGQLATSLFARVRSPSNFLAPVAEPVDVAREIIRAVDNGESGEISVPLYARWVDWLGVVPVGVRQGLRWWSGVDAAVKRGSEGVGGK